MENKNEGQATQVTVPYVVYRDAMAQHRWLVKGLVIALLVSIFLMFASNAIWLYEWNQYDYSTDHTITTVDSEGNGVASFIGGDIDGNGGVVIGEGGSSEDKTDAD